MTINYNCFLLFYMLNKIDYNKMCCSAATWCGVDVTAIYLQLTYNCF